MVSMSKTELENLTEQLRRHVGHCGTSQRSVAIAAGIDPATLSRFMTGQRGLSMEALDALGQYFNLELVVRKPDRKGKK